MYYEQENHHHPFALHGKFRKRDALRYDQYSLSITFSIIHFLFFDPSTNILNILKLKQMHGYTHAGFILLKNRKEIKES